MRHLTVSLEDARAILNALTSPTPDPAVIEHLRVQVLIAERETSDDSWVSEPSS